MTNPHKILIVDDDPRAREVLQGLFAQDGHQLAQAACGHEALAKARSFRPDVMLLDLMMPDMDGFDVCKAVRADPDIASLPIILVTALDDKDSFLQGIEAGADEFVAKPFNRLELKTRVRGILRLNRFQKLVEERKHLQASLSGTVDLLSEILAATDPTGFGLAQAVRAKCRDLAEAVGEADLWTYELSALLARIGTVTLPPRLMAKVAVGAPLDAGEAPIVAKLPETSANLLRHVPGLEKIAEIVLYHEKHYSGAGFPPGSTRGEQIPLGARILHVATDFCRLEAFGQSPHDALQEMRAREGRYDPALLECLHELIQNALLEEDEDTVVREVRVNELQTGWRLRQDLLLKDGTLLLSAGNLVSAAVFERIRNFSATLGVQEPFLVEYRESGSTSNTHARKEVSVA